MTFGAALRREATRVDAALEALLAGEGLEAREALGPALAGGKRLRPALLLLVHGACGGAVPERALRWACGVELIHAATLVHDDVLDGDATRRGRPALHAQLGPRLALLAGDAAVAWGIACLEEPAAARAARAALREAWLGAWDEARGGAPERVARGKTASLFRLACGLGALAAETPPGPAEAYGEALGLAYQAADDTADGAGDFAARAAHFAGQAEALAGAFPAGAAREALRDAPRAVVARALAPLGGAAP